MLSEKINALFDEGFTANDIVKVIKERLEYEANWIANRYPDNSAELAFRVRDLETLIKKWDDEDKASFADAVSGENDLPIEEWNDWEVPLEKE